jgi:hypothetical protein
VSRKGALKIIGGVVTLAATSLLQGSAAAGTRARRRCRRKGGTYLSRGECRCAVACGTTDPFACRGEASCFCGETVEGSGACLATEPLSIGACSTSIGCPMDAKCVLHRDCPESGGLCEDLTECPANNACIDGRCQRTFCYARCPASP